MAGRFQNIRGGVASYPPGARLHRRKLPDYEFVWVQRGNVIYHADGHDLPAPAGTVILARPGFSEGYTWDPAHPTRHAYFHFEMARPPAGLPPAKQWPVIRPMPEGDVVRPLFEFVVSNLTAGGPGRVMTPGTTVARAIETLLSAFVLGPIGRLPTRTRQHPEPVSRALEFIGKRLSQEPSAALSLADLAQAALVSPKHLCRVFAGAIQVSPMDAVMAVRLHHAAQLLARTDLKLDAIARHCGFATAFHFSRRFKDFYRKPPRNFRADALAGRAHVTGPLIFPSGMAVEY